MIGHDPRPIRERFSDACLRRFSRNIRTIMGEAVSVTMIPGFVADPLPRVCDPFVEVCVLATDYRRDEGRTFSIGHARSGGYTIQETTLRPDRGIHRLGSVISLGKNSIDAIHAALAYHFPRMTTETPSAETVRDAIHAAAAIFAAEEVTR